jgi:transposase
MQLSDDDLSQLNEDELLNLPKEVLRHLSLKLLNDLKDARERLNQNSRNSSRPPSCKVPWDKAISQNDSANKSAEVQDTEHSDSKRQEPLEESDQTSHQQPDEQRKPGKQPGAKGFGRQQVLAITDYQEHIPEWCTGCHQPFNAATKKAYTAFETVDIEWADENNPGLRLTNTKHTYYQVTCTCGRATRKEPYRSHSHNTLPAINCSEWKLVGPGLAALIICLAYRMRLSRERIQEFLHDWLGLQLSVGTINNTLHESGAPAKSLEDELVKKVIESQLLHVDGTHRLLMALGLQSIHRHGLLDSSSFIRTD